MLQPNVLREEAKSELLKEVKGLLSMRARVRKEVLEEVKEAMEVKLGVLEKREMAWREEKREALAELDLCKERMREEAMKQMEVMELGLATKSEEVKESVRDEMRGEYASKATLKKAVETMPLTVAQVALLVFFILVFLYDLVFIFIFFSHQPCRFSLWSLSFSPFRLLIRNLMQVAFHHPTIFLSLIVFMLSSLPHSLSSLSFSGYR